MIKTTYLQRYATSRGISLAEATGHEIVKEYYRHHPEEPLKPIAKHYEDPGEPEYIKICCPGPDCRYQVVRGQEKCVKCGQALDWEGKSC